MRKFFVGFISLGAVLAVYLLYSILSNTPVIGPRTTAESVDTIADSNFGAYDSKVGKIGEMGIGPVQKARYVTLNKDKEVEREFGFEELLHEARDMLEIEKPYMNIYQRDFRCYITADRGEVQVETAVGKPTPKDATFTSNVVVHILPENSSDIEESFIYLDEVVFLSERSQLSTAGSVKFVSAGVQMLGTGLELIYDAETERLEFLRIIDLESLRIRNSQADFLSGLKAPADSQVDAAGQVTTQQPEKAAVGDDRQKAEALPAPTGPQVEPRQGEHYRCVLYKNVVIDSPKQLVFADEQICINDIFWSHTSRTESGKTRTDGGADETEHARQDATVSEPSEPNELSEQSGYIVVTCDGGVVLTPAESVRTYRKYGQADIDVITGDDARSKVLNDNTGRTKFLAPRIEYNATTGDVVGAGLSELAFYTGGATGADGNEAPEPVTITAQDGVKFSRRANQAVFEGDCFFTMPQGGLAEQKNATLSAPKITVNLPKDMSRRPDVLAAGPAELVFYMEDSNAPGTENGPLPVKVTAQRQAAFLSASNQIVFEGDSRCTMLREDPNVLEEYMLLSQQITVDLPKDVNEQSSGSIVGVEHLTAVGGVVRLATVKTAKAEPALAQEAQTAETERFISGIELRCQQVDYDPGQGLFVASGQGVITLNSGTAAEREKQTGSFSLRRPCWVVVENFVSLKYFLGDNRIVADTVPQETLWISYVPIVNGQFGQEAEVTAGRIEALLHETDQGQTELSTLTASGGIDYEDADSHFIGSELFLDHKNSVITVRGDASQPCYLNGALVDGIEYDLITGKVEAKIVAPGTLQMNR